LVEYGYAGEILKIDLNSRTAVKMPSSDYTKCFLGGRGLAAKLYWDMVPPETGAFVPDNCLVCVTGPVAGFTGLAGFRWQVCSKTAAGESEAFSYANLGGPWGARLKFAGYDGLVVQGKADKPVYVFIHDGIVEFKDASQYWGKSSFEAIDGLKAEFGAKVSVLTIGPAAENMVRFATLFSDQGASGSAGLGSIMGSKLLKAIVVSGDKRPVAANPERLKDIIKRVSQPVRAGNASGAWAISNQSRLQMCYGCGSGCSRYVYPDESGKYFKSFCQATEVYQRPAKKYYGEGNKVQLMATRLCDSYGLDTIVMQPMIEWLIECYEQGILTEKDTGLPLSEIGSAEFIEILTRKIALREGFGELLAQGTIKTAESVGKGAEELICKSIATMANEKKDYDPRLMMHTALLYATEPRRPIHQLHKVSGVLFSWLAGHRSRGTGRMTPPPAFTSEHMCNVAKRFWGSEAAADFSTHEGKSMAAKVIQDRAYVNESLILCDLKWPMAVNRSSEDGVGDPTLESQIYSAITGNEMGEEDLYRVGERNFNLQRAILLRQGWGGREGDKLMDYYHEVGLGDDLFYNPECLAPGKNGEVISRKGAVVERSVFEEMKDEYYRLRSWDVATGLPTETKLRELDLDDVASDMKERKLLA
jgi:aldehyde:ferredoxin oxidoreductase